MNQLKVGDIVILKDFQSLKENAYGLTCKVKSVQIFNELNKLSNWGIYELDCVVNDLFLVYQQVNDITEVGVYFSADGCVGNRIDALNNGFEILFQEPNINSIYANTINHPDGVFKKKFELTCKTNNEFAIVCEWEADSIDNNQLMVTEVGQGKDGGLITFLRGCHISEHELEILRS